MITEGQRSAGVAVDHQRQEKDHFYPTEPPYTKALLHAEQFEGAIWEPACGEGHISEVLKARGHEVVSTDLVDRGYGEPRVDFLMEYRPRAPNIITNPPFKLANEFIQKAIDLTSGKVAMILRIGALAGQDRQEIFENTPLARVWVISNRLQMFREGVKVEGGGMFDFAWFVWQHGHVGRPEIGWINTNHLPKETINA